MHELWADSPFITTEVNPCFKKLSSYANAYFRLAIIN